MIRMRKVIPRPHTPAVDSYSTCTTSTACFSLEKRGENVSEFPKLVDIIPRLGRLVTAA